MTKYSDYALTDEQVERLWAECKELPDKVLVGLMLYCGLRLTEAVHLRADWIKEGWIAIPKQIECGCPDCKAKGGYWRPFSVWAMRPVPVAKPLEPILAEFLKESPNGLSLTRWQAWYRVKRLYKAIGIRISVSPASLRATFARRLAEKGIAEVCLCYVMRFNLHSLRPTISYIKGEVAKFFNEEVKDE